MNKEQFITRVSVDASTGCWNWQHAKTFAGYGNVIHNGKPTRAHRLSLELFIGPIPSGLVVDHLCGNKICVNPSHLEAVPQRLNVLRGKSMVALQAKQTHCLKGHPLSGENVRIEKRRGGVMRVCKACKRRRYHEKRLARVAAVS